MLGGDHICRPSGDTERPRWRSWNRLPGATVPGGRRVLRCRERCGLTWSWSWVSHAEGRKVHGQARGHSTLPCVQPCVGTRRDGPRLSPCHVSPRGLCLSPALPGRQNHDFHSGAGPRAASSQRPLSLRNHRGPGSVSAAAAPQWAPLGPHPCGPILQPWALGLQRQGAADPPAPAHCGRLDCVACTLSGTLYFPPPPASRRGQEQNRL